jgi:hypothetical protein
MERAARILLLLSMHPDLNMALTAKIGMDSRCVILGLDWVSIASRKSSDNLWYIARSTMVGVTLAVTLGCIFLAMVFPCAISISDTVFSSKSGSDD